ncbi:MAG TPA: YaaR family protein [Limnochordales bacterium]
MERARLDPSPGRRRPAGISRPAGGGRLRARDEVEKPLPSFNTELLLAQRRQREDLEKALAAVDEAAEALRRCPGERTLFDYREAVRRFLELALPGSYRVERATRLDVRGVRRLHVVVRCVHEQVDRLAREVLARHRDSLAIAARLSEIRGLLLDLVR